MLVQQVISDFFAVEIDGSGIWSGWFAREAQLFWCGRLPVRGMRSDRKDEKTAGKPQPNDPVQGELQGQKGKQKTAVRTDFILT